MADTVSAAALRARFDGMTDHTVGVAEELMLLDPDTLDLLPAAARVHAELGGRVSLRTDSLHVVSSRSEEDTALLLVVDWNWSLWLALPVAMTDVLTGTDLAFGEELHLGAWDVRVLLERPRKVDYEEGRPLA